MKIEIELKNYSAALFSKPFLIWHSKGFKAKCEKYASSAISRNHIVEKFPKSLTSKQTRCFLSTKLL